MKKVLLALVVFLGILAVAGAVAFWWIFGRVTAMEDGAKHGPVTTIVDGYVSCFLIDVGAGKYALVDACADPTGKEIIAALDERDATTDDVLAIFLTHGHSDHVGGARAFEDAQVFAHTEEIPLVEGEAESKGTLTQFDTDRPTAKVTGRLSHEQTVGVGNKRLESLHLPGHTPGSVAILVDGVLLLGDSGQAHSDGALAPAPEFVSDDPARNVESLVALAEMIEKRDVEVILPSHSGPLEPSAVAEFARNRTDD